METAHITFKAPLGSDFTQCKLYDKEHACTIVVHRHSEVLDLSTFTFPGVSTFSFYKPWTACRTIQDLSMDDDWGSTLFSCNSQRNITARCKTSFCRKAQIGGLDCKSNQNIIGSNDGCNVVDAKTSTPNTTSQIGFSSRVCAVQLSLDAYLGACVLRNCRTSRVFLKSFQMYALTGKDQYENPSEVAKEGKGVRTKILIVVRIHDPHKEWLSLKWNNCIGQLIAKRGLLEDAMSWLNTLGGGFSALGDYFVHHAEEAERISLRQMKVALEMGDPPTIIRCWLYLGLSFMQRGYLRRAKYILRAQYQEAQRLPITDTRLMNSCQGLWCRLAYLYSLRRHTREQPIRLPGVCLSG